MYIVAIFDEEGHVVWSSICNVLNDLAEAVSHACRVKSDNETIRIYMEV